MLLLHHVELLLLLLHVHHGLLLLLVIHGLLLVTSSHVHLLAGMVLLVVHLLRWLSLVLVLRRLHLFYIFFFKY